MSRVSLAMIWRAAARLWPSPNNLPNHTVRPPWHVTANKANVALRVSVWTGVPSLKPACGWGRGSQGKEQPPRLPFEPAT